MLRSFCKISSSINRLRSFDHLYYFESAILSRNPAIIELINNVTYSSGKKLNPIEASLDYT